MGIREFLMLHSSEEPISFHMPGHKGRIFYDENGYGEFLNRMMDMDITEIPGADNLFQAEGIIEETMSKYRHLYGAKASYLLINGSSAGVLASILTSVSRGGQLIMARNCHKSAFNALYLGNITPTYAYPEIIEKYGITGGVTVDEIRRCFDETPEAEAVIIASPNYYGVCSNIKEIAAEVHRRGKILIVDQAHGAHLKFFENSKQMKFPKAAESLGADLVVNSTHKTLGSFTQTAILNVCSDKIDMADLEDKLQIIESSSPSYPLMASLDINADLIMNHGEKLMRKWEENLEWFYEKVREIPGVDVMMVDNLDSTKINIDMSAYGLNGSEVERFVNQEGIFSELLAGNLIMFMTGIGNKRVHYEKLLCAIEKITKSHNMHEKGNHTQPKALKEKLVYKNIPGKKEWVSVDDAIGRICANAVIPYPPGVPLLCPGEVVSRETVEYIKMLRAAGEKVIGISDGMTMAVGKCQNELKMT